MLLADARDGEKPRMWIGGEPLLPEQIVKGAGGDEVFDFTQSVEPCPDYVVQGDG